MKNTISIKQRFTTLKIWLPAFLAVTIAACYEKIDLELDGMESRIVIDARITDLPDKNRVLLTESSTNYLSENPAERLEGATVTLSSGKSLWHLKEAEAGEYLAPDDFKAETNQLYTLEVDTGKEVFRASSEMKGAVDVDSINVRPHPWLSDHYELVLHFQDPPGEINYYMCKVYKNGVLLTDNLNNIPFADSEVFSGRYVSTPLYIFQPEDGKPVEGDTIKVQQYRITEDYFHFLVAARRNQGTAGGPFVGPPSNLPTNFDNNALGFFMTASVSSREIVLNSQNFIE